MVCLGVLIIVIGPHANEYRSSDIADAVLAFSNNSIVGAALVFSGVGNNQISKDIPWPRVIGERVGGLACVGMGRRCSYSSQL